MTADVLCLRPLADFERVGVTPPSALQIIYRGPTDTDVPNLMRQASALLIPAVGPKLPASLFEGGSGVRFVQVTGAGVDRLELERLKELQVVVANVPGGSNNALAEYTLAAALILLRRIAWADREIRLGNYAAFRARMIAENLAGIEGLLLGVIGFGTIGKSVARAFRERGAQICYYDPAPADGEAEKSLDARAVSLEELLETADIVTLHLPLLPSTQNLIGARELARMKPGAILIQASRGGIVDEAALAQQLQSCHLAGAAVDVYAAEPPPANHPLLRLEGEAANRVLLTPHIAGVTRQSAAFLFRSAWRNIERVLIEQQPPLNRVI